jgi:signal transduction histidine kinase
VITLVITGLALLVLIQNRPLPNAIIWNNLATQLISVISVLDGQDGFTAEPTGIARRGRLTTYANIFNIRILLRKADGTIGYDSAPATQAARFRIGEQAKFQEQPFQPNAATLQQPQNAPPIELMRGSFRRGSPEGVTTDYLYIAQAPNPAYPDRYFLLFAQPAPRLTAGQITNIYGPELLIPLAQAGIMGLGVAFLFSILITRSVVRPIQQVAATADAITKGQRDRKAPIAGTTEVRQLAIAFNQMMEQAEVAQTAQRDFLANVSHDLKTPLTSIQGYSQAIVDGVTATPEGSQRAGRIIYDEASRMLRMVEELIDLARIEAGKLSMTRRSVRIGELVSSVGERLSMNAKKHSLTLTTQVPAGLPPIAGDGDRLSQVLTNLIDNAIKHTPAGGVITLQACIEGGGIRIDVHDTGEGIPADDLPRIFERFYQVDKSRQRRDGAGLGLQICYQIVQAHHGRIWVESVEGEWTRFSVWLPAPLPDASTIIKRR